MTTPRCPHAPPDGARVPSRRMRPCPSDCEYLDVPRCTLGDSAAPARDDRGAACREHGHTYGCAVCGEALPPSLTIAPRATPSSGEATALREGLREAAGLIESARVLAVANGNRASEILFAEAAPRLLALAASPSQPEKEEHRG